MANTTVTKVSDLLLTNVTAGAEAGKQKVSEAQGFTEVLKGTKDSMANQPGQNKPEEVTRSSRTVVESPKSKEIKAEEPVRKDPIANKDDMAELTEEVADEVKKIFDKITEVLGVSEDELTQAMEDLGITPVDLLDPISVKELCMELMNVEDSISLLTNADLYENIKDIVETAETAGDKVAADFGLVNEDAKEILKDESFVNEVKEAVANLQNNAEAQPEPTKEITEDAIVPAAENIAPKADNEVVIESPKHDMDVDHQTDAPVADIKDTNAAAGTEAKAVTIEVKGTPEAKPAEDAKITREEPVADDPLARTTTGTTETFKAAVKSEESSFKGDEEGFDQASRFTQSDIAQAPQQTTVVNTEVNNLGDVIETVTQYSNSEANSIMSQVTESIRVNYSADTTSMEMQLHPASLGTVNMHIASSNGVVTAQILVESEAVKAALESQLMTLQQTFEEQGQKVEAVEVAVANYDLNKGNGSEAESDSQNKNTSAAGKVGTRRRINLADLDEEALEELSEEEKLSADMMARSGNSVDYTA